jgi:hypothetical protein
MTLPPDGTVVVFCDGHPEQGPLHAPFDLKAGGDRLVLVGTAAHGDYELLDVLDYGQQQPDMALARLYCGGEWVVSVPTPGVTNILLAGDVDLSGSVNITDAIGILNYLFGGGSLACPGSVDTNGDLDDNLSDAVYLFNFLFNGGPAPLAPLECR